MEHDPKTPLLDTRIVQRPEKIPICLCAAMFRSQLARMPRQQGKKKTGDTAVKAAKNKYILD